MTLSRRSPLPIRQLPKWALQNVEPTRLRHALAHKQVWVLREIADHPDSPYSLQQLFRLRCIFFHVPKTGGLAVSEALFGSRAAGHINVDTAKLLFGVWRFRTFFKFCLVRNPWDRLVSTYHYLRQGHPTSPIAGTIMRTASFADFVKNELRSKAVATELHIRPQWSFLADEHGRLHVDFVGRFEHLVADVAVVAKTLGVTGTLPVRNRSSHRDYRSYYDRETRLIVADFYEKDIELFKYRFDTNSAIDESDNRAREIL